MKNSCFFEFKTLSKAQSSIKIIQVAFMLQEKIQVIKFKFQKNIQVSYKLQGTLLMVQGQVYA